MLGPVILEVEVSGKFPLRMIGSVGPKNEMAIPFQGLKRLRRGRNPTIGQKTPPKTPRTGHIEMPKASSEDRPLPSLRPVAWQWNSVDFRIFQFEFCSKHEKKGAYTDQI